MLKPINAQNGWQLDPTANATLRAVQETGQPQTVRFDMRGMGGDQSTGEQSASFTPNILRLEIVVGDKVV